MDLRIVIVNVLNNYEMSQKAKAEQVERPAHFSTQQKGGDGDEEELQSNTVDFDNDFINPCTRVQGRCFRGDSA